MSPRTAKTLDCGWESKVGLQKLVFKVVLQSWSSKVGLQKLVFKSWSSKLVFKSWSSKFGLQKINVVLPMNKRVILETKHNILNKCQHVLNKKLCP